MGLLVRTAWSLSMSDSTDVGRTPFFSLFYAVHWLVIACAIFLGIVWRAKTLEVEKSNDGMRGKVEVLTSQRAKLNELEETSDELLSRAIVNSSPSNSALSDRIRTFTSTKLTEYLPDDFSDLQSKADEENKWQFAYAFEENGRYILGLFSSRKENQTLRVEVRETNAEYLAIGTDMISVHEIKTIRQGWNFLTFAVTRNEDDIRLTARLTDKMFQHPEIETFDFGSLKTMLDLSPADLSKTSERLIWGGDLCGNRFVYGEQHPQENPDNKPICSLLLKSPTADKARRVRVDFRMGK